MQTNSNGDKFWLLNGERHRTDGPAIEYANGTKYWYVNGERHKTDGPAVDYADGRGEWYLNGERIDPLVFWVTTKERQK